MSGFVLHPEALGDLGVDSKPAPFTKVVKSAPPENSKCGPPAQHVIHSNAETANARFAAPLARFHCDDVRISH